MSETKRTLEQTINAIKGSDGIKTTIADKLGVTRQTVDAYLRRWATAQQVYDEECEKVGDLAESVLVASIRKGDTQDAKWYLSRIRREKYATRTEQDVTSGGEPIAINFTGNVSPDEL